MAFIAQKLISASGATEETDPDFNLVTQLYQFDGTNGAQNNTYVDSSSTSKTLTESGNIVQGSFSPFSADEGKWSGSFDGTNDYLLIADSSDLEIGSSEFTMECWFFQSTNSTSGAGSHTLLSKWDNDGRKEFILRITESSSNQVLEWYSSSDGSANDANFAGNTVITNGKWHHAAATRDSGNTIRLFLDGVLQSSTASQSSTYTGTHEFMIGANGTSGISQYMDGFISNVRFIKGTALYTSTFTPSASPLTAVTNTKLLTCCSNRFYDKSTSAHGVTPINGAAIKPFSPFAPSAAYDAAVNGGSAHFPTGETGNKIECASSADFAFGTGAFTVEGWAYATADTYDYSRLFAIGPYYNNANSVGITVNHTDNSDKTAFYAYNAVNGAICLSTNVTPRNQWFHWAVTRDSTGDFRLFTNGNLDSTNTSYRSVDISPGGNQPFVIGSTTDRAVSEPYEGLISNVRVVKGTAVYTSSFTVPTSPVADVTNTKLLANFTNAAMFDQTGKTNINTIGNAQLDTSIKKFGTASAKFDEGGDYLVINTGLGLYLRSGDFTIEGFVYFNSSPTDGQGLFVYDSQALGARAGYGPALGTYAHAPYDGKWHSYYGTQATPGTGTQGNSEATPSATTWIHFAYVRTSGVIKIFIDGSQIGSDIAWTGDYKANGILTIGGYYSTSYLLNGYIDSYRVTLKARYTSNFTAPTEAFLNR